MTLLDRDLCMTRFQYAENEAWYHLYMYEIGFIFIIQECYIANAEEVYMPVLVGDGDDNITDLV